MPTLRFASLGSGSEGNALLVAAGNTTVLLDCGFSLRETLRRLARLNVDPEQLDAILVTHEHGDHIGGVARLAARLSIPVYASYGTFNAAPQIASRIALLQPHDSHETFSIGDIEVSPFPVPHDAREPTQFVFSDGQYRLGVLTDVGTNTHKIETMLNGCDALLLECNHDRQMLWDGPYPVSLKQRVGGNLGHLDNKQAADILRAIDCNRLQHIVAAHLSRKNNRPELARAALAAALNCEESWIGVADQAEGFAWRLLGA